MFKKKTKHRNIHCSLIIQSHIRSLLDTPKVLIASATNLEKLQHHIMSNVNALRALGQPIESWDAWLVTLICSRLDSATVGEWQLQYNKKELPLFCEVEAFLLNHIAAYQAGEMNVASTIEKKAAGRVYNHKLQEKKGLSCYRLYLCKQFDKLSVCERRDVVMKNNLCFKCLNGNHQARICKFSNCSKCGKGHNIKLHLEESDGSTMSDKDYASGTAEHPLCNGEGLAQAMHVSGDSVMLATAIVLINNIEGVPKRCRALLDSGSQINFITDACAQSLKLSRTNCHLPVVGINSRRSMAQKLKPVLMSSRFENFSTLIDLHVLPSISNTLPAQPVKLDCFKIPEIVKSQLADPSCGDPGDIQLLIGAEVFYTLFSGERFEIENSLMFHNTVLGWVLTGKVSNNQFNHSKTCMHACFNTGRMEPALSLFVSKPNSRRTDEQKVEKYFNDTHYRDDSGRFVVRLPINTDVGTLGDSSYMAQRRFLNLERRLSRDKGLGIAYHKFMSEYLIMNHMALVTAPDPNKCAYYLPHHTVMKKSSITNKLRVVFDGSAPSSSGLSLNDILYRGPKVQPDLLDILLRFR
ncbi:DUF1758 domain-containing protein, partial [Aphis craccivora]